MEAFDGCILDRAVHPLNLPIRPGMTGFRQAMFDPVGFADPVEAHGTRPGCASVTGLLGELDAIVRQNGMNPIRDDAQKRFEKLSGRSSVGFVHKLRLRKLACAVYGDEKTKLSFCCLDFGNIEVKEPDRIAFEALVLRFVAFNVRQTRNPVTLKTAMQC
ncbi:hypothetical protein AAJCM20276_20750 [Acetobacter aceti]|uniref:Uncharacterized protein n=1 Tax=Acetobacter aceti TaxID=435 RepID=A0A6S6PLC1_ACEAC|nr:hypothetical protein AAJCM20276_20750 [Acetobacter aceti]